MKKLPKVALIAPPWLPVPPIGYGGIEQVIHSLVPNLRKLGVSVELFTVGDSTLRSDKKHWLYKTGQFTHIHRPYYDALPILIAHLVHALNEIKKDGTFDIIHDHNPYIGPAMFSFMGNDMPPILHTLHGPPFTTADQLSLGIPDNLPMWRELAKLTRIKYVNISEVARKQVPQSMRHLLLKPVYNGIIVEDFPFVSQKDDYFMTLARFHPNKGQSIAIQACLKDEYHLKMAGVVGDLSKPKQVFMELANPLSTYRHLVDFRYFSDHVFPFLDEGRIDYVGDLSGTAKMKFISKAKALLFPIQWDEPFGMAVVEALACGTPVVAMARGAMLELIQHGVNGFLANNVREFRMYMKRVSDIDPAACRASVEQAFSAEKMAQNYLDRYQSML